MTSLKSFKDGSPVEKDGRFFSLSVALLTFFIMMSLSSIIYYSQKTRDRAVKEQILREDVASIQHTFEFFLNERLTALNRMAARWSAASGTPKAVWEVDAKNYVDTLPGIKLIAWIDPQKKMQWRIPYQPDKELITFVNKMLGTKWQNISPKKQQSITMPAPFGNKAYEFASFSSVSKNGHFDGYIFAVFDIHEFFREALAFYKNLNYMITLSHNGVQYFQSIPPSQSVSKTDKIYVPLKLFGDAWELSITPTSAYVTERNTYLSLILFTSGLFISLLLSLVVYNLMKSRRSEAFLAKTMDLFTTVLKNTRHLIIATDPKGIVTLFNQAAEAALGYSAKEIVGIKTPEIWHDVQEVVNKSSLLTKELGTPIAPGFEVFVAKVQKEIISTEEWTFIRKNGTSFPGRLTPTAIKKGDVILGYLGVIEDISEQKHAEHEIKDLKRAMEHAVDGIAILDTLGHYIQVNEAYARMTGYRVEELIGMQWELTVHTDDQAYMLAEYQKMLVSGKVSPEARGVRKDGSIFYKQLTMISHFDENNTFIGHFCFMKDISERKMTEQQMALLASIVASSEDAMISKSLDGIITAWNKGAERLFGYSAAEIIGKKITLLFPKEQLQEECWIMSRIKNGESVLQLETVRIDKYGKRIHVSLTVSPIVNKEGKIIGASKVARDISERIERQQQLELMTDKLVQSNTELERFAYIASHDLQEPVRMITNFSEIIATDYQALLDEEGKEYLQIIVSAGLRMKDIIDDLLSYSRMSNEDHRQETFDSNKIVNSVKENLRSLLDEKKAQLICDPLPLLFGNPVQILRLIQNLVVNAIKYQPPENIPEIHISAKETAEYWWISIQDNGLGIKPEFLQSIFQPFKRLHSWNQITGTGLGLAICKKIVANHQGTIQVESEYGKGSTFSFSIPKHLAKGVA